MMVGRLRDFAPCTVAAAIICCLSGCGAAASSTNQRPDVEQPGSSIQETLRRAKERMMDRVGGSKIVILATHSLALIRQVCNRAVLIDNGRVKSVGSVSKVVGVYKELLRRYAYQETLKRQAQAGRDVPAS